MPTQEERLTSLERNFAQFKQDSKMQTRRHHEDDTIILGVLTKKVEDTNHKLHAMDRRFEVIENRLEIIENRLDTMDHRLAKLEKVSEENSQVLAMHTQMLTAHGQLLKLILARLPEREAS